MNTRASTNLLPGAVVLLLIAALLLGVLSLAQRNTAESTLTGAEASQLAGTIQLVTTLYNNDAQVARDMGAGSVSGNDANRLDPTRFLTIANSEWQARPEITGAFLFDRSGLLRSALGTDADGNIVTLNAAPLGLSPRNPRPPQKIGTLGTTLRNMLNTTNEAKVVSFNAAGNPPNLASNAFATKENLFSALPFGETYLFEPAANPDGLKLGVVVLRIDNERPFKTLLTSTHAQIIAPPFVLSERTPSEVQNGTVEVVADASAAAKSDVGIMGNLTPVNPTTLSESALMKFMGEQATMSYQLNGTSYVGRVETTAGGTEFPIIVSDPAPQLGDVTTRTLIGPIGLGLLLGYIVLLLAYARYQTIQRERRILNEIDEQRTRRLTDDILVVSDVLDVAREGDLRVELPVPESEVGLMALVINGLLSDYSRLVGGIVRAVRAVEAGAKNIDVELRAVIDAAELQKETMTTTAQTMTRLVTTSTTLQQATQQATELAETSAHAVGQGQGAVGRIGEAVDSIKEAAIGTTREFKRLQEDSIRLTALVSSVKSNAENLDMQAANAALEARHLGTETGSAFATNIGRLARQAQDTLADAETAVRSVISSIDAVNRRIERISEQVRVGVDEVRSVRATFEQITASNSDLVGFIDSVATTAEEQASGAGVAAQSIETLAEAVSAFANQLVTAGDEMAQMRLVIGSLGDSVANLRVDESLLNASEDKPLAAGSPAELAS